MERKEEGRSPSMLAEAMQQLQDSPLVRSCYCIGPAPGETLCPCQIRDKLAQSAAAIAAFNARTIRELRVVAVGYERRAKPEQKRTMRVVVDGVLMEKEL